MSVPAARAVAWLVSLCLLTAGETQGGDASPPAPAAVPTGVCFQTSNADLQRLYDAAVAKLRANRVRFTPTMTVLVEGGEYPNAWIETQPMGGEMYARHDVQVAMNNQLVFMMTQREDGRLPGMVVAGDTAIRRGWDTNPREGCRWFPAEHLAASFEMLQGYCFPEPAWRVYFWAGRDKAYLRRLYTVLERSDAYLWRTRDSDGDGLLETWCVWDTGEDGSTRLVTRGSPSRWPFEKPPGAPGMPDPTDEDQARRYWFTRRPALPVRVPFASMDVMAYSYAGRATLAKIAQELGNGKQEHWRAGAEEVRRRLVDRLWVAERHACFDLDRDGRRLEELVHNNLRCMWYGVFTQEMADAFVEHHLLSPDAFWTPVPLVSMPVREPLFRNRSRNDWSGQPQGLTYQRAVGALENYGHYAEVTLLGRKLLPILVRNGCRFTQQLDPFTGEPGGRDGYGPMTLAALEYLSRMHGVHLDVEHGRVWWSGLADGDHRYTYRQRWGQREFELRCEAGRLRAMVGGREVFTACAGARVVTDLDGELLEIVGIDPRELRVTLETPSGARTLAIGPNRGYRLDRAEPVAFRSAPFAAAPGLLRPE